MLRKQDRKRQFYSLMSDLMSDRIQEGGTAVQSCGSPTYDYLCLQRLHYSGRLIEDGENWGEKPERKGEKKEEGRNYESPLLV